MNPTMWVELEGIRLSERKYPFQPQERKYPFLLLPTFSKIGKENINSCKIRRERAIGARVGMESKCQMPGRN